jgi:hypothetical protein
VGGILCLLLFGTTRDLTPTSRQNISPVFLGGIFTNCIFSKWFMTSKLVRWLNPQPFVRQPWVHHSQALRVYWYLMPYPIQCSQMLIVVMLFDACSVHVPVFEHAACTLGQIGLFIQCWPISKMVFTKWQQSCVCTIVVVLWQVF